MAYVKRLEFANSVQFHMQADAIASLSRINAFVRRVAHVAVTAHLTNLLIPS